MILLLVFTWLGVNAATPTTLETVSTASSCMIIYITCVLCARDTDLFFCFMYFDGSVAKLQLFELMADGG